MSRLLSEGAVTMRSTIRTGDAAKAAPFIRSRSTPNPGWVVLGLLLVLFAPPARATHIPAEILTRGILTYDRMMIRLWRVTTLRPDVRLSMAPYRAKASGRAIPVITVGHGPRKVFITAMQHGNEYRVSNAAVEIVEKLSRRSNEWMRSALTVVVMPRVNVDGFDRTPPGEPWLGIPWRQNVDPTAVGTGSFGAPPYALTGVGWDINRYHPAGLTENPYAPTTRSEEHTSELQSLRHLVCR